MGMKMVPVYSSGRAITYHGVAFYFSASNLSPPNTVKNNDGWSGNGL
jgi:hypothetical protein